ncbi:unnamed protein product [Thlaspi arvense]|uniref:6-phosphogluconolactonase n=1 Tax=Thlaspi arvense TaxID=13288 RepID=A0AAU9RIY7_THLAR|nr:unnamed protein product [Thlaspi arvense]
MSKKMVFPTKKELAEAMATYTATLSAKFCKERGCFTVVLSGGDLISWLSKLLEPKYHESIEWSKWHIFWVDDRVVPWDHKDSNYKLAMDGFLSKVPIPTGNIYAIDQSCAGIGDAKGAALLYEECIKRLVNQNIIRAYKSSGFPQFDLQLLGMGPDGHMASLFPGHYHINEKASLVTYITDSPKLPPKRITFTLPVINCASYNLMAVCDEAQADAVAEVFNDNYNLPATWLTAAEEAICRFRRLRNGTVNLTCSSSSSASRFESLSVSSIGSGSIRRLADSRRKVPAVRSMATTAAEIGKDEKKRVEIFELEENLAIDLAKFTADLSDKFCKERGAFTVVVSGGSLIKSLRKLVEPPYVDSIDWSRWHFFWVDERVVPKNHDDSNYKLAYDCFLSKVPIPPGNVYAINESLSAEAAADDYETCLKHLVKTGTLRVSESTGFPKFDLMLLGMGPDGHVASLFPGHGLCNESKKWVTFITDSPKPPSDRITFTFPVINSSAHVALVVCGSGKAEAVQAALKKTGSVPAGSVSAEDELVWFLDKPASSKL